MNSDIKLHRHDLPDGLDLASSGMIAVDCEMTGLNIMRDRLCTVQISTGKNDAHIIQFDRENYTAPNLIKLFKNNNIKKIFHYGRMDLLFLRKYLNVRIENILDTKIASKISRTYSSNHGLKDLIKEVIGIDVNKQMQTSDFGGDLSEKQLKYAGGDVLYLHKIHEYLEKILTREKRIQLYKNVILFINIRVDLDLASFNEDIWSH